MIKRLRKKFIAVAMCSVFAVLTLVFGIINTVNYIKITHDADEIVAIIKEGGGKFDYVPHRPISPETPFKTRFFTVTMFNSGGWVQVVNIDKIASIDANKAATIAKNLYDKKFYSGFYGDYKYDTVLTNTTTMYIFVDISNELGYFRSFLLVSVLVGLVTFILIFALLAILSGRVTKPIAESYEKQKQFITDASHEIKTPLTIIGANAEVLEMQGVQNEWTESIKEQVKRLSSLTEKLVFLSKMEEENNNLNSTDFSLSDAVEETIKPFYSITISKGLKIESNIQKNITYCGDEKLIRQLVSILLDNALKYSDDNGIITVELKHVDNKTQLLITNPANKLADGNQNVLFERFYRGDKSRNSADGGHGIGLSIANAIVLAHKSKISAYKKDGQITFSIIF